MSKKSDGGKVATVLSNAVSLHQRGDLEGAALLYTKALKACPGNSIALGWLGVITAQRGDLHAAEELLKSALREDPKNDDFLLNYANVLQMLGDHHGALSLYGSLMEGRYSATARSNQSACFLAIGDAQRALESAESAIALNAALASGWSNQGVALRRLGRFHDAIVSLNTGLRIEPNRVETWQHLAGCYTAIGDASKARVCWEEALRVSGSAPSVRFAHGLFLLQSEEFEKGWASYGSRKGLVGEFGGLPLPQWSGIPSDEENVLLLAEQGVGDEILLSTLIPLLASRHERFTISADARLLPLFRNAYPLCNFVDRKALSPLETMGCSSYAFMGDLGSILQVDREKIVGSRPKNSTTAAEVGERDTQSKGAARRFGLTWKSASRDFGEGKNLSEALLSSIFQRNEADILSLQYGATPEELQRIEAAIGRRLVFVPHVNLYSDLVALSEAIKTVDLLVTASNVTAHLAGFVGHPTALIIPNPDSRIWYWGSSGTSLWYPSVQIFCRRHDEAEPDFANRISNFLSSSLTEERCHD